MTERLEAYITTVHKLAENCGFGALKEELIRDRIVVGIRDKRLSERLQMDSDLTLAKAIQKVRQSETVKKQQTIRHSEIMGDNKANKPSSTPRKKSGNRNGNTNKSQINRHWESVAGVAANKNMHGKTAQREMQNVGNVGKNDILLQYVVQGMQ